MGLVKECSNSIANAQELQQSCTSHNEIQLYIPLITGIERHDITKTFHVIVIGVGGWGLGVVIQREMPPGSDKMCIRVQDLVLKEPSVGLSYPQYLGINVKTAAVGGVQHELHELGSVICNAAI